ncbi:MAG TPA: copper-containing nitrite reductase [Terracidiphilus sp.]|nr:copper-containing nitrite reductase [Terracidiphilus sp.]
MGAEPVPTFARDRSARKDIPAQTIKAADIVRDPSDLPPSVGNRPPAVVHVTLTSKELVGVLDPDSGTTYRYWTFDGKVPGPFIRVRQGDTVEVTLKNAKDSTMVHSIDLHAVIGPGGGAALLQVPPGQSKTFTFRATTPGLFVYHCGSPMIAQHIANGMYGLILVEPSGGLPHVDHEYYLMQGELYTSAPKGKSGLQQFSLENLTAENAQYYVFNGAVDSITKEHPLGANEGETLRIFFGNAGPNATASMHMVGQIFTRYYQFGSLSSPPLEGVQTATVPPGDAGIFEVKARAPGEFAFMDHAMSRMEKGDLAFLEVKGPENTALVHAGAATLPAGTQEISGVTAADVDEVAHIKASSSSIEVPGSAMNMAGMNMAGMADMASASSAPPPFSLKSLGGLIGCLTVENDGKAMLEVFHSHKVYRLEAQPFLFGQNAGRLVHVGGHFGSVLPVEDPRVPSYVVDTVEGIEPNCSPKITTAEITKALEPPDAPIGGVVTLGPTSFMPATITITAGQQVVWKNASGYYHNVVDDPARALNRVDVSYPSGTAPFGSSLMYPGTTFYHVFNQPGVYHYVCTIHESAGMKGIVIVRPGPLLASNRK